MIDRNPRYIFLLVIVAALILVVGALTRPKGDAAPPASDADLARLSRLAERHSLDNTTSYFGTIATTAEASLVRRPDEGASGVVWQAGLVVAARMTDRVPAEINVTTSGVAKRAPVTLGRPDVPVIAMAVSADGLVVPQRRDAALVRPEEWVLAVWTGQETRSYVHGNVLDVRAATCDDRTVREVVPSFSLTRSMAGGGLFDIDGNLIGVILPCGDRLSAMDTATVDALLAVASTDALENGLMSRYGLRAGWPDGDETAYFTKVDGPIVREVWMGYPAFESGLRPGDVIRAIDDVPVDSPEGLARLASASAAPRLAVRRGSTNIDVLLGAPQADPAAPEPAAAPAPSNPAVPDRGLAFGVVDGYRVNGVVAGSAAAAAGIHEGDRLIRINGVAPTSADQIRRLLGSTRGTPAFLEIERGRRRFGVVLK